MIKWTINADKEFATGDWVNQKPFEQLSFQLKHGKEVGKFKELKQDGPNIISIEISTEAKPQALLKQLQRQKYLCN